MFHVLKFITTIIKYGKIDNRRNTWDSYFQKLCYHMSVHRTIPETHRTVAKRATVN